MKSCGNKRIAINTIAVYIRLGIVTIVSLLTTKYVLQVLGVSDYGLYNVVGSIIVMLNTISIAMHTTTRRFINVEMGKRDGDPNKIFNVCLFLHFGFALFFLLIAETIGIWYINNYLNVSPEKGADAHFVFQVSVVVACIGLVNVPYQGLIEAFEKFWQLAVIDVGNTILKLIFVIFLIGYDGNALRFYALAMSLITLSQFIIFRLVCYKQWHNIVRFHFYKDKKIYSDILVFNNYTTLGAFSFLGQNQGIILLINHFFGTVVNGAFAVAYQIQNFVLMFIGNFGVASAPQITQCYSLGEHSHALKLCSQINRFTVLIMIVIFFPVFIRMDFLLKLWLGEIPEGTLVLSRWVLINALVGSFSASIPTLIQATGKIKWFQIIGSVSELSVLPVGYLFFCLGYPPVAIIIVLASFTFFYRFILFGMMKVLINFRPLKFMRESYLPPFYVIVLMIGWTFVCFNLQVETLCGNVCVFIATGIIAIILCYVLGLTKTERNKIILLLNSKIVK